MLGLPGMLVGGVQGGARCGGIGDVAVHPRRLSERGALMGYPEYRVQVRTSDDPLRCRRPSRMEGWDPDRTASPDSL